jgi:hypothetical protein
MNTDGVEVDGLRERLETEGTESRASISSDQLRSEQPVYLVHELGTQQGRREPPSPFHQHRREALVGQPGEGRH